MVVAPATLDTLCINSIRFLAVDAVNKSKSGHPGLPMGCAPMGYTLWDKFLKHNPKNPKWFNRDRFVLSRHGCMLYALLHLTGYDSVTIEDFKQFRQWGSRTPVTPKPLKPWCGSDPGPLGPVSPTLWVWQSPNPTWPPSSTSPTPRSLITTPM